LSKLGTVGNHCFRLLQEFKVPHGWDHSSVVHSLKKRDLQNWVKAKLNPTVARPAPQRRVVKHYGDFILMNTSERLHSTLLHIRRHISPHMMIVRAGLS